jgi:tRNA-specific 2-thiouridylase
VATGHYAQISKDEAGYHLLRGADPTKDQSYFLYGLKQAELANTIFPVGHLTKSQVRELAAAAGLATASKPESQDICFVSGEVQDFIVRLGGKAPAGKIVDTQGKIIGQHNGIHAFTVGQRKGLKIAHSEPLYVVEIRPDQNTVVAGAKSDLEKSGFMVNELSWVSPVILKKLEEERGNTGFTAIAQLRYRHKGVPVALKVSGDRLRAEFAKEWSTVSPGQVAVFYDPDNREVLGGGRILPFYEEAL